MASATDTTSREGPAAAPATRDDAAHSISAKRPALDPHLSQPNLSLVVPRVPRRTKRTARRLRFPAISKLTWRILAVNLVAVAIVVVGIFYLDQYSRALVDQRLEALAMQGEIMAAALGESAVPRDPILPQALDPRVVRQLIRRLVAPINIRARLFDRRGRLLADSRMLAAGGAEVRLEELPPPEMPNLVDSVLDGAYGLLDRWLRRDLPLYIEYSDQRGDFYAEVRNALNGDVVAVERVTIDGAKVLSVAVPVQRFKRIVGALMMTTDTGDIEARVRELRNDIMILSVIAFVVTVLLSIYLAGTIARPIRHLAHSAEQVTGGSRRDSQIPDLSARGDEIGELSTALRRMTGALWERIDAIDGFAADVAHELKNPLSSLRSAAETINRVDDPETRQKLLALLLEDVRRMDRLITDISAASRLDAELSRAETGPVDVRAVLSALADVHRATGEPDAPRIEMAVPDQADTSIRGIESRIAQIFRNLIDNAISFSPPGGRILLAVTAEPERLTVTVEDDGPGIPPEKTEAIFDRFYSQRPAGEKFGTHSGLGLSIIRQIVEAHGGRVWAENRPPSPERDGAPAGARFSVCLPR